ncbi:hypothetical protein [Alteromonas macleodii]|uniref:Uncharacterized protein n=1 Tax=Alteromonas macleodii TaxID=28108 RepID=A0AB36FRB1_ALTMA|nr:hypothetical protein [Alteromonas macleodii]OES24135.1 hypothetical protein BFV93_4735 [Alteromonas macleodii]OES24769.1 hypothetical protein BFV95_4528 [Alteromonas macleodii]OES25047.1 hypothetical protein BFV94_4518 [Alteromonas macleodii]OES39090.1 hypothetical protein BFV96_4238 [Alteromonas macleodii]
MFSFLSSHYDHVERTTISVDASLEQAGIDVSSAKSKIKDVAQNQGKVEAIKHLNRMITPRPPMPLKATYDFVNQLVAEE